MRNFEFFLDKLSELGRVEITCYSHGQFWDLHTHTGFNPLRENTALRDRLIEMTAKHPQLPALIRDAHDVLFAAILWEDDSVYNSEIAAGESSAGGIHGDVISPAGGAHQTFPSAAEDPSQKSGSPAWFLIGPAALHSMDVLELHQYYRTYADSSVTEKHPPVLSFARFISMVQIAAMVLGKRTDEEEIIRKNHLDAGISAGLAADQVQFSLRQEEEESAHHTYSDEQALLNYIREGRAEEALHLNMRLDQQLGQMSQNRIMQWRKLVTVSVALASRAAIDGGVSPGEAYKLSDYYLQKSDTCMDVPALIACRNQAVRNFCERVAAQKERRACSGYVQQCCEYVCQHYREKILLDDIADHLHISPTYLSRIFSREMKIRLQEYISRFRVERAANLLKYSDESIARIGDYVGFPSQSYFGNTFKRYTGMTPGQYREKHQNSSFR